LPEPQGSPSLPGILDSIVRSKREELGRLKSVRKHHEARAASAPPARDFGAALRRGPFVSLIAEVKRRSPGAGEILPGLDPAALALAYEAGGASALSVLTDGPFFGGSEADLAAARSATSLPVLRKDFMLDSAHLIEARAMGADAVLLIVRILDAATLRSLLAGASALGMAALVEAHDDAELECALDAGARIVGINNRDLATFRSDLDTTLRLLDRVPPEVVVVSESGIRAPMDVLRLGDAGVDAVLVGETLLRSDDPAVAAELHARAPRGRRIRG
jgi:indole-3-glycerol phosphate synthase